MIEMFAEGTENTGREIHCFPLGNIIEGDVGRLETLTILFSYFFNDAFYFFNPFIKTK